MKNRENFKSACLKSIEQYAKNKEGLELKKQMQDIAFDIIDQIFDDFEDNKLQNKNSCITCKHYDFADISEQICTNINNHQIINDNQFNEDRYYQMTVTPDFYCNEWEK